MLKISKKSILGLAVSLLISSQVVAQENKVYAVANGIEITQQDVAALLRGQNVQFEALQKDQQRQLLDSLIEQKLLAQMAYQTDIPKSDEFKKELEKLKQNLAFQIWLRDFSQKITIQESEVKKFYDDNRANFKTPEQLKASHILVKSETEAKEIIKTLEKSKNKKEDFTKLAKEKSVGPSGSNGGELGWFTQDKMVPEFSSAAMKLQKGAVSKEPVKTNYGFHVIYLDDKKSSEVLTFDQVKVKLKQDLLQQKFAQKAKEEAEKLKNKAKIEYK